MAILIQTMWSRLRLFTFCWGLALWGLMSPVWGQSEAEFLDPEQAFHYEIKNGDDGYVWIEWTIAPDYYLYRKRLQVEGIEQAVTEVIYPDGNIIHDEFFGDSEVYHQQVTLKVNPGEAQMLQLRWQGCAEAGLCYPPQAAMVDISSLSMNKAAEAVNGLQQVTNTTPPSMTENNEQSTNTDATVAGQKDLVETVAEDQRLAGQLAASSLWLNLAIFFGLGLLLAFTPCVLPMIPILSSVVVGSQARKMKAFTLSLAFVLAMAVTYAFIGVVAALAGSSVQATLQKPAFIIPLVVIFIALALSMFGLYELQLPLFLRQRLNRLNNQQKGGHLVGAAVMGIFSALLASPCMTAPLAGALIYIADSGNALYGGLTLFALGLGMGAPLVLMATIGSVLLPKPGLWMNQVKAVFGFILLGTAIWFLSRLLEPATQTMLWGGWIMALGISIYFSRQGQRSAWNNVLIVTSILATFWGSLVVVGAAAGTSSLTQPLTFLSTNRLIATTAEDERLSFTTIKTKAQLEQELAQSQQQGRWTLVDFYADWCVACKVIEAEVFSNSEVVARLEKMTLLRIDVTDYDGDDKELMSSLKVLAPPSILLFDPQGNEARSRRVVGELSAAKFLEHLPATL